MQELEFMDKITITPQYNKDLIKTHEKFVRYRIFNVRKFYPGKRFADGKSQRDSHGKGLFITDWGDALQFSRLAYTIIKNYENPTEKPEFRKDKLTNCYRLKIKDGRVNLWSKFGAEGAVKPRNKSNSPGNLEQLFFGNIKKVHPVYKRRLNSVIKNFLRRHKIKFKYSSNYLENILLSCYPGARDFRGILESFNLNSVYSKHFRRGNIKYVVKACFGFNSKKLLKMVCEKIKQDKNFDILVLGCMLKGLIPLDYFYRLLESDINYHYFNTKIGGFNFKLKEVRKVLKNFNSQKLLNLFVGPETHCNDFYFDDSIRLYPNATLTDNSFRNVRNWIDIHNVIAPTRFVPAREWGRNYKAPEIQHFDLPIREGYDKLDGQTFDNFTFEVPKNTQKLHEYSDKMNNCIRGYGQSVKNGMNILGVYKNLDKLTYNISIQNREINQFKGIYNQEPPEGDKKKIIDILVNKNIIRKPAEALENYPREYPAVFID